MKDRPLLSICIPTYNRAKIVEQCVKNLLSNDHEFFDVVVTDNASTDNTQELLSSINDSRLIIYKNDKNIGYANLMLSQKNGDGKYTLLLSDEDDLFDVDWEKLYSELTTKKEISGIMLILIISWCCLIWKAIMQY